MRDVGGGCCIGFESSILSYLDRVFISSRQSRIKSRELREPYTQKQPTVGELKEKFSYKRSLNKRIWSEKVLLVTKIGNFIPRKQWSRR